MTTLPAVILAGGLATRRGGGDKGLWRGGTLLGTVIAPKVGILAQSASGDPGRFALGLPVLPL